MGIYDEYEGVQLKVGDVSMHNYKIGDKVHLIDGVYFASEGIVVIDDGIFVACLERGQCFDKWGGKISVDITERNSVLQAIKAVSKKHGRVAKSGRRT